MRPRFLASVIDRESCSARLEGDEAHHLTKVLRLAAGAVVHVFDGRGGEWTARVEGTRRERVDLALLEPLPDRRPALAVTLVQSVLKGPAMDDVVRDCTMVGVRAIRPVVTEHTTVKASALTHAAERWGRVALASAKQCGAAALPHIAPVQSFETWLTGGIPRPAFLLIEPDAAVQHRRTLRQLAADAPTGEITLLVGPEGGWSTAERDRVLADGAEPLSLGPLTLRASTVGLVAAAALLALWSAPGSAAP